MKVRLKIAVGLLAVAAAWYFWPRAVRPAAGPAPVAQAPVVAGRPVVASSAATNASSAKETVSISAASTNQLTFRLANTSKTISQLSSDRHAILLENAFIDTTAALADLKIPSHLKAGDEPGAYIVQARGPIGGAFRAAIGGVGGTVVSYIPNNAYLVQVSSAGAAVLTGNPLVQAVLPYEPYYKVQSTLLGLAVAQKPLPAGTYLTLGLFNAGAAATETQLQQLGAQVLSRDRSPFGPIVRVQPPQDWLALVNLPGVQIVEPVYRRKLANDLSRVALGISTNTTDLATNDYLGLTGKNILVEVNDTGIDPTHPDFSMTGTAAAPGTSPPSRVTGDTTNSLYDTDGHGTHVAGIIAGNGSESYTITNAPGSVTNADFRGKAPNAMLYSVGGIDGGNDGNLDDSYLQEAPALTNALISNNSWEYGNPAYDLAAASYDAAVRDAVPEMTGPQPVMFVFAAGNDGGGNDNGSGGTADTVSSPGTAKDVLTIGALEQLRNITNIVTELGGASNAIWAAQTDSKFQVAGYSSRGNVGIQTEGSFGRFKPDVVAPGTFVISTRSTTWDEAAYYNVTNNHVNETTDFDETNTLSYGFLQIPQNAVQVTLQVVPNDQSPTPFPTNFPIYVSGSDVPDPTDPTTYDFMTDNNFASVPPGGGTITTIAPLLNGGLIYGVADPLTNSAINFDVIETIITTNDLGNELMVLSNLNDSLDGDRPPHYYRFETGTSMATAAASGVLALMQDFFVNQTYQPNFTTNPSPALLKAMIINGARLTGNYQFAVTNTENFEGWGQIQLPNSLPAALTNTTSSAASASNGVPVFFVDQSPTNALATGESRTYNVSVPTAAAQSQPLRVTLVWTDPPGNPAAAIKLVNNLTLVVTNNDNPTNPLIYLGNSFTASGSPPFSSPGGTNSIPDNINNVQNVFLSPTLGTNYSVTVYATAVNVNAVTAEQTNVVQDFALVISCGDGSNTNGIVVTPVAPPPPALPIVSDVSYLPSTNAIYFNQYAGANAPWLSTNGLGFGTNSAYGTNAVFYIGQTNQWHFFVVTNTTGYTNAAFILFQANTAALPREGVFASTEANSTTPEADLTLFVSSVPDANAAGLTNLSLDVVSNCLFNLNGDQSAIGPLTSEFVAYTNSQPNQIYYIGVQCQDQTAGQYAFVPIFSQTPFSTTDPNGNVYVHGLNMPVNIPDGDNRYPGVGYVFGLCLQPIQVQRVIETNTFFHQNFGDLTGTMSHNGTSVTLNNHDGLGLIEPTQLFIYDDSGQGDILGAMHSDGPGSLVNFQGSQAVGLWELTEVDDSFTQTGRVNSCELRIEPHRNLNGVLLDVTVPPQGWFYDYVDVPAGYTNLLVVATNLAPTAVPPIQLYVKEAVEPTLADTNDIVSLTNCVVGTYPTGINPGNSISVGPPLPPDRYFVGLYNPSTAPATVLLGATLSYNASAVTTINTGSSGAVPLLDDAVTTTSVYVSNTNVIQNINVGLRIDHPRISDLVITLISPDGSRYLLMENRGGQSTNGCGLTMVSSNVFGATASGDGHPNTNYLNLQETSGTLPITYNFYTAPDEMTIYYGTNISPANLIYDTGLTNNPPGPGAPGPQNTLPETFTISFPPPGVPATSTYLTIIMNQYATNFTADAWTYQAGGVETNYLYLNLTDDTNLTTTPIKFAPPPFVPNTNQIVFQSPQLAVPGTANPWLAGMPNGSLASANCGYPDSAPGESPTAVTGLPFNAGDTLTFSASGAVTYSPDQPEFPPNGNPAITIRNPAHDGGAENGLPDCRTPYDSMVGVFLDGVPPNLSAVPAALDFSATSNQDYTLLAPGLKQIFFIGTGLTSTGGLHHVIVPAGATQLFLGTMDGCGWNNNLGVFTAQVTETMQPTNQLYYQPEQSLAPLYKTSAYGNWQLEILDDRAGATNFQPELISWNLGLTYANTNYAIPQGLLLNGQIQTNYAAPGSLTWFEIDVPPNAVAQTNTLVFASLPLNIWFSTNAPPTTNSPSVEEQTNSVGGSVVVYPGGTPLPMVPGSTNYLGVQNPNQFGANYAVVVNFDLPLPTNGPGVPFASTLPATQVTGTNAQLNGFATANGTNAAAWFEWGVNTNYGNGTPAIPVGNGFNVVYQTNAITNLIFAQVYHARLVVSNAFGTTHGADVLFAPGLPVAWGNDSFGQTNIPAGLSNVVAVAGGLNHSLALLNNLTVTAWGDNTFGQTTVPTGLTNVAAIAAGGNNSLALLTDGTVVEWGNNGDHETNALPGVSNVVMVAAGAVSSVALLSDGTVMTWGDRSQFQRFVPPGLSNVVAVASGGYGVMALLNNGTVVNWGDNNSGDRTPPSGLNNVVAVADGDNLHSLALSNNAVVAWGIPVANSFPVPASLTNNVVAIAAGQDDSLVLLNNGSVAAWGLNTFNQTNVPAGLGSVFAVACGNTHDLVLQAEPPVLPPYANALPATLVTGTSAQINGFATPNNSPSTAWFQWGSSTNYGNLTTPVSLNPGYQVVYLTNTIAGLISGQAYHYQLVVSNALGVAASFDQLLVAGSTVAWGDNTYGQSTPPAGLSNVVTVAAGGRHSLEALNNGAALAWGDNSSGQTSVPSGLTGVVALAGGTLHSLALLGNGLVTAWGDDTLGQTNVPAVSNVVMVAAGGSANLVVLTNGLPVSWGDVTFGQTNIPGGLTNVVGVAEGAQHSLALLNNGTVVAWGDDTYGQTTVPSGLNNVVAVSAGFYHSLALLSNGVVVAWGNDTLGQTNVPAGLSNVVAIAAGGYHNTALRNDGSIIAWGDNTLGQTTVPASASNVVAVAAGGYHNVVLASPYGLNLNLFPFPTNGLPFTNILGAGGLNWYQINVPTNATAATNTLVFASLPVNLWWSSNAPPTITNPNDTELLTNQTAGSVVLYPNTPPPTMVPGGVYYLGVQNPNSLPVTNALQVTFDYAPVGPILPNLPFLQLVVAGTTLTVTNTALYPLTPLNYGVTNTLLFALPPGATNLDNPTINPTNGIITWVTSTNDPLLLSMVTTVVTDPSTGLSASNSFYVIVFPEFPIGVPVTNSVPPNGIAWTLVQVPVNALAATNALLSASAPVNLWYSTNLPPSTNNLGDTELLTNTVNGTNVISVSNSVPLLVPGGFYFLGVQNTNNFAITDVLQVTFRYRILPPVLPVIPTQVISGGDTLQVTNTATDTNSGAVLVYSLTNSPAGAVIDTNGIITWPTTAGIAPTNVVITTVVRDTATGLSATNSFAVLVLPPLNEGLPETNIVGAGGIFWYLVKVPHNADEATNYLLFATAPVNLWFSTNVPPSITNTADFEMLTHSTGGLFVMNTNIPPRLVPGSKYYLGVQNTNAFAVTNAVKVKFHLAIPTVYSIFSIVQTNNAGTNGFLLTWYEPTNTQFHLQWTTSLLPATWANFKGVISFTSYQTAVSSQFQYFDDGSQTGGFAPTRFYRLLLLNSPTNTPPEFVLTLTNDTAVPLSLFTVTNSARDWDLPPQQLTYFVTNTLPGTNVAVVVTNTGVITWTPDLTQSGLTNFITTIVTDNGVPAKSTTNVLAVVVGANPVPMFGGISITTNGVSLQWQAPTNDQFYVRWTTNLLPPITWTVFPPPPITSTNGMFQFTDTNLPFLMKFYQLILLP